MKSTTPISHFTLIVSGNTSLVKISLSYHLNFSRYNKLFRLSFGCHMTILAFSGLNKKCFDFCIKESIKNQLWSHSNRISIIKYYFTIHFAVFSPNISPLCHLLKSDNEAVFLYKKLFKHISLYQKKEKSSQNAVFEPTGAVTFRQIHTFIVKSCWRIGGIMKLVIYISEAQIAY